MVLSAVQPPMPAAPPPKRARHSETIDLLSDDEEPAVGSATAEIGSTAELAIYCE